MWLYFLQALQDNLPLDWDQLLKFNMERIVLCKGYDQGKREEYAMLSCIPLFPPENTTIREEVHRT